MLVVAAGNQAAHGGLVQRGRLKPVVVPDVHKREIKAGLLHGRLSRGWTRTCLPKRVGRGSARNSARVGALGARTRRPCRLLTIGRASTRNKPARSCPL